MTSRKARRILDAAEELYEALNEEVDDDALRKESESYDAAIREAKEERRRADRLEEAFVALTKKHEELSNEYRKLLKDMAAEYRERNGKQEQAIRDAWERDAACRNQGPT